MIQREIWWADLPDPAASEPGYRRPVLIVQANEFNQSKIHTVICAVITSNLKLAQAPGNVLLKAEESNLPKDSVINVSQLITLDKSFLAECVGTISDKVMKKVQLGIKLVLNLN
jgi:mRNA interferase MazF